MLSPISETLHLVPPSHRQPKLEFTLALMNIGAYAFAAVSLLAAVS